MTVNCLVDTVPIWLLLLSYVVNDAVKLAEEVDIYCAISSLFIVYPL